MIFWLTIALVALVIVAILARTILRHNSDDAPLAEQFDMQIYRDQLDEVERDLVRGTITKEEAERTRVEVSRRLLLADRAAKTAKTQKTAPNSATYTAIIFSTLMVIGGGFVAYDMLGVNVPGKALYADMPLSSRIAAADERRETRASQAEIEAKLPLWSGPPANAPQDYVEQIAKLRSAVAGNLEDLQGQELLSIHEARLGNYVAAHKAMSRVIALKGAEATAEDFSQYADILILSANGEVSPEAESALRQALRRDPQNKVARYYSGLMYAQIGRPDRAFRLWHDLLHEGPADALWMPPVRAQIGRLAAMAGVDYILPELVVPAPFSLGSALAGPSAEDMAAAADMSAEDRAVMIDGMVAQLSARLANEGGTVTEWVQLIGALTSLGQVNRAAAVWEEAQIVFERDTAALVRIRSAMRAGLPLLKPQGSPEQTTSSEAYRMREIDNLATNLSDRLATSGGPPEIWVQLITALTDLGETSKAQAAWSEAQKTFAEQPENLEIVRAAVQALGLAE